MLSPFEKLTLWEIGYSYFSHIGTCNNVIEVIILIKILFDLLNNYSCRSVASRMKKYQ